MNRYMVFFVVPLLGLSASLAFCQAAAPSASDNTHLNLQSSLVIVPALVRTKSGDLVFTLKASDFVIRDNGVPQKVTLDDEASQQPLALVVVIEVGGAGAREFDNNKYRPLLRMFETLVGATPHEVAVVSFDSQASLVQPFTKNIKTVVSKISDLTPRCSRQHHMENCEAPGSFHDLSSADNGAAILDGLAFAVDLLRERPPANRRAVLLISETRDRGSHTKLEDAVRQLTETNTTIYSIGFSTGKSEAAHYAYRELPGSHRYSNPPHGCMGKDPSSDPDAPKNRAIQAYDCLGQLAPPLALTKMLFIMTENGLRQNVPREVARLTGGEYFKLTSAKSLERSLTAISNHLPNRYLLSFHPQQTQPGFHAISVLLSDRPDLDVTARAGYWVEASARY